MSLQKNHEGLIRSILNDILQAAPGITPLVFPQYWDPSKETLWQADAGLKIPKLAIFEAFETVVGSTELLKDHCFCFFIDGLDEFDDSGMSHTKLVKLFKTWAEDNPTNVKICVSSREENPFMNNLSSSQRMRLHLLTADDVRKHVKNFLGDYDTFQAYLPEKQQDFVDLVVRKAEGVFLWVKLVLRRLGDDLEANKSLENLYKTLKHVPKELEELFSSILTSIDIDQQQEAWAIVAVLMATIDSLPMTLSLLHYSFVEGFFKNDGGERLLTVAPLAKPEILARHHYFTLHLNQLFKGILEVGEARDPEWAIVDDFWKDDTTYCAFRQSPSFTHRSIYEFLQSHCPREIKNFISDLDVESIVLQCLIAHIRLVPWDILMAHQCNYNIIQYIRRRQMVCSDKHLELLWTLDELLVHMQTGGDLFNGIDWSKFTDFAGAKDLLSIYTGTLKTYLDKLVLVLAASFSLGFTKYVIWVSQNRPNIFENNLTRARLFMCLIDATDYKPDEAQREFLRYLSESRFLSTELLDVITDSRQLSVWKKSATKIGGRFVMNKVSGSQTFSALLLLRLMKTLLEFTVDPRFTFNISIKAKDAAEQLRPDTGRVVVAIFAFGLKIDTVRMSRRPYESYHTDWWHNNDCQGLQSTMSLREIIEWAAPDNCAELLKLIDRNVAYFEKREAESTTQITEISA